MSLLTVCQTVLQETGFPNQTAIVGNTDETARRLYGFANRSGNFLLRKHDWTILRKEYTWSTVASTAAYNLPSDFSRFIPSTEWDRTNYWALEGPLTPQEWQFVKSGLIQNGPRSRFRIMPTSFVNQFTVDPVPSTIRTLVFEYICNTWVQSAAAAAQSSFLADTDTALDVFEFLIGLDVMWRFRKSVGLDYAEEKDEFQNELDQAVARDGSSRILSFNKRYRLSANTPEGNFG